MTSKNSGALGFILLLVCMVEQHCLAETDSAAIRLPADLIQLLRDRNEGSEYGDCTLKEYARLYVHSFHSIDDERLLWLIGAPDYMCDSNSFFPVIVDDQGQWSHGEFIEGEPYVFMRLPRYGLLLSSQWTIEGTFPFLFFSSNGLVWQEMTLPEDRDLSNTVEYLTKICVQNQQTVHLTFEGDGNIGSWHTDVEQMFASNPNWVSEDKAPAPSAECSTSLGANAQKISPYAVAQGDDLYEIKLKGRTLKFLIPRLVY
jgi:hypothetical protein